MMEFIYLSVAVTGKGIGFKRNRWRSDRAMRFLTCLIDNQLQISGCD